MHSRDAFPMTRTVEIPDDLISMLNSTRNHIQCWRFSLEYFFSKVDFSKKDVYVHYDMLYIQLMHTFALFRTH